MNCPNCGKPLWQLRQIGIAPYVKWVHMCGSVLAANDSSLAPVSDDPSAPAANDEPIKPIR